MIEHELIFSKSLKASLILLERGGDQEARSCGPPEAGELESGARSHSPGLGGSVHVAAPIFWPTLDQRLDATGVVGHTGDAKR